MKFGIVVFPGSNCDRDMYDALKTELNQDVVMLWHKDEDLSQFTTDDCIVLPGGFSFGDYLRCGAIAHLSPMMKSVTKFANDGGKVLGICNGFQILCEAKLLPGALLRNNKQQFVCKNVFIKSLDNDVYKIPIAHGEGRYHCDEKTLSDLKTNNNILFKYCDENGNTTTESNPNGSINNIAGICNNAGNVIGMMPHPERAISAILQNNEGKELFTKLYDLDAVGVL